MKARVIPVTPEEQFFIDKKDKRIPNVARNKFTGWPLLELGVFYHARRKDFEGIKEGFTPALGGGKCQFVPFGIYAFAHLVQQSKAVTFASVVDGPDMFMMQSNRGVGNIKVQVENMPISIMYAQSEGYEALDKTLIQFNGPQPELSKFLFSLEDTISFKPGSISFYSGWHDDLIIRQEYFDEQLNPEVAVFFNGKLYVDFGTVLDQIEERLEKIEVQDDQENKALQEKKSDFADTKEAFKDYFGVEVYLKIQNQTDFVSEFERIEKDKIVVEHILFKFQKLVFELTKEKEKFEKNDKQKGHKKLKYSALADLFEFITNNSSKKYISKSHFIKLYQSAMVACSERFQEKFFSRKSENLNRLIKCIPEELIDDILTKELIQQLPEKYQKLLSKNEPTHRFSFG